RTTNYVKKRVTVFKEEAKRHIVFRNDMQTFYGEFDLGSGRTLAACLIHASRAREAYRSLRVDVCGTSGGRVSNTWATCLQDRDNTGKPVLIPDDTSYHMMRR